MSFGPGLNAAARQCEEYWSDVEQSPVLPFWTPQEIRIFLKEALSIGESRSDTVTVELLAQGLRLGTLHLQHPGYFGLFNPGVTPVSCAADLLVAAFNPQLAAWSHGGFASEAERHTLSYFSHKLGLPHETSSFFTSGGQEANQAALFVALVSKLKSFAEEGLNCQPTIYVSAEAHHSFHKAAKACGIGMRAVREVPVDSKHMMVPGALASLIESDSKAGKTPVMVVATLGTTGAGAIDPVIEIRAICDQFGLWLHADAAWAAAVSLSENHFHLIGGIENADSVTWDAHKWLQVPMGAGMFFCTHPEPVREAFGIGTAYMPASVEGATDGYDSSPQWSRRATGLKVLAQVLTMGDSGLKEMIDHMFTMGDAIRNGLTSAGWTIINDTELPLVCFTHPVIQERNLSLEEVLATLYASGRSWVSIIRFSNGLRGFRACITNRLTQICHIEELVAELNRALERVRNL